MGLAPRSVNVDYWRPKRGKGKRESKLIYCIQKLCFVCYFLKCIVKKNPKNALLFTNARWVLGDVDSQMTLDARFRVCHRRKQGYNIDQENVIPASAIFAHHGQWSVLVTLFQGCLPYTHYLTMQFGTLALCQHYLRVGT